MKLSTSQAAKLLKIHPDTLRKRAKAGKIPYTLNVLGHMQFEKKDLLPKAVVPPQKLKEMHDTRVIFVIDESVSMGGLTGNMDTALREQVASLRDASTPYNKFFVSDVRFGSGTRPQSVQREAIYYTPVQCTARDGSTALFDGIGAALEFVSADMHNGRGSAYLVVVITDGQENSSRKYSSYSLKLLIDGLSHADRLTIAVNCPPGGQHAMQGLGIAPGNIRVWEQTAAGVAKLSHANVSSTQSYANLRSTGQTTSNSFYANVGPDGDKVAANLGNLLEDVTKDVDAQRVATSGAVPTVKSFAEKKFGGFNKGSVYYELSKKEKIQEYKQILVQDQKTGKFYRGWDKARQLLGLPAFQNGEIKVSPGTLGDFKVFVQSTSVNRKLVPGTTVVKLT